MDPARAWDCLVCTYRHSDETNDRLFLACRMCGTVRAEAATTAEQDDGAGAAAAAVPSDSADGQGTKRRSEEAGLDATPSEHRTLGTDHTSQKIKSVRRELDTGSPTLGSEDSRVSHKPTLTIAVTWIDENVEPRRLKMLVKRTTALSKVARAWRTKQKISEEDFSAEWQLCYNGECIQNEDTPDSIGLAEGDVLTVALRQQ